MRPLDVIYINYNSTNCLISSIETLFSQDKEKQHLNIVVVDNSSDDDPHRLKYLLPEIKLVLNRKNIGFGAAINQALTYCHSKYIILLNPDSLVTDGFLETSISFIEKNDQIGIMGPMILDEDGTVQGSARTFPTPLTSLFGRNSPITKMFPNNSITKSNILTLGCNKQIPMEVDWVSGACMVVRREAMQAVGGFDKRFFLYWEDTDLCRRIWNAGWKVVYFPEAKVVHSVGKSSNTRPIFANYQFHKSCYRLYEKYAKGPFSIFTPLAAIALMYRFLIAVIFNSLTGVLNIAKHSHNQSHTRGEQNNHKIRVLRVISRMNIGGPSIHVKNLTEGLNKKKYESKVIAGSLSPSEGDMSYLICSRTCKIDRIHELQRELNPIKDLIALIKLLIIIDRYNPDIVHSHMSKAGTLSRIAVLLCNVYRYKKIKKVHTFHGHVFDAYFGIIKTIVFLNVERILSKITDRLIAISNTQKWELSQKYKVANPSKIKLINLGFDLTPFVHAHKFKGAFRHRINVTNDTILIGIVGRLAQIKNHKMFLDAAAQFLQKKRNVKFLLIGDGELRQTLEEYVVKIGIQDYIVFYGWEENIPMVYADLDILALTSLNEGTPVSIIEAMAACIPVVTTGVGGVKDLLGRIESESLTGNSFNICERGIFCPKNDSNAFSTALIYMVESDYLLDRRRFEIARDFVVQNYSAERLIQEIETLYEKLMISN